jgi:hypothetical protein
VIYEYHFIHLLNDNGIMPTMLPPKTSKDEVFLPWTAKTRMQDTPSNAASL